MKLSDIAKRMIKAILAIAVISVLISMFYYKSLEFMPFLFGIILGSAASITKVYMLEKTVDQALDLDGRKSSNKFIAIQQLFRFIITGLVLIIGAIVAQISLLGVAIGVIAFHPAIYLARPKSAKKKKKEGDS